MKFVLVTISRFVVLMPTITVNKQNFGTLIFKSIKLVNHKLHMMWERIMTPSLVKRCSFLCDKAWKETPHSQRPYVSTFTPCGHPHSPAHTPGTCPVLWVQRPPTRQILTYNNTQSLWFSICHFKTMAFNFHVHKNKWHMWVPQFLFPDGLRFCISTSLNVALSNCTVHMLSKTSFIQRISPPCASSRHRPPALSSPFCGACARPWIVVATGIRCLHADTTWARRQNFHSVPSQFLAILVLLISWFPQF